MNRIPCPVNAGAQRYDKLPALIVGDKTISYGDYEKIVAATAAQLQEVGIAKGERVAIISGNRWEYPTLLYALWRSGAVACPISPRFPEEAIRGLLRKIHCSVVVDPRGKITDGRKEGIRKIGMDMIHSVEISNLVKAPGCVHWDLDDHGTIILTSGSSAQPKAVLHCLSNHYFSARGSNKNIPVEPGDRWLLSLPLFHVGGMGILFRMALGGGAVVMPVAKESVAESMARYAITHLSLVSTQLQRLLNGLPSAETLKALKAILLGGSAVPPSLISRAHEAGLPIRTTYGLTEMASQVTTTGPHEAMEGVTHSGRVLDYRQLRIDDGEILVRGKTLFKGYVEEESTALPLDDGGWFRTGDLGRLDSDGCLSCTGRKDNMFISGGENIHPEEIEGVLYRMSDILETLVVPMAEEEFGFRPGAFVRLREDKAMDETEMISFLERHLPRFKIPIRFFKWPEKMGGGTFKPDRGHFRKLAHVLKKQ